MKDIPPTLTVGDPRDDFCGFTQAHVPITAGFMVIEVEGDIRHPIYTRVSCSLLARPRLLRPTCTVGA